MGPAHGKQLATDGREIWFSAIPCRNLLVHGTRHDYCLTDITFHGYISYGIAHRRIRKYVYPLLDILAGLPSVIYGVWGSLLIVPFISKYVAPLFIDFSSGYTVLAGGIVLGVMIIPLLVSLFMEIFDNISKELREASLSLGATQWQTIKYVVLRKARPGMIAAIVLALSRTLGETIAVLMVCGNLAIVPGSLLDACYPIPALIANNYGEMLSVPLYDSALMFAAFLLFFVVVILNLCSRIVLLKVKG